jgi:hypothetical protein
MAAVLIGPHHQNNKKPLAGPFILLEIRLVGTDGSVIS